MAIGLRCDHLISSPLVRARQTAELALAAGLAERLEISAALAPGGALNRCCGAAGAAWGWWAMNPTSARWRRRFAGRPPAACGCARRGWCCWSWRMLVTLLPARVPGPFRGPRSSCCSAPAAWGSEGAGGFRLSHRRSVALLRALGERS
ncbi:hypothetical protein [Cyanobium sp. ATX-6F1]|uniref:hypothetical protein n=1 Tax=Cyanobium sp. ATX-6F1 TaxID=3137388 RepID=UPI0039BE2C2D